MANKKCRKQTNWIDAAITAQQYNKDCSSNAAQKCGLQFLFSKGSTDCIGDPEQTRLHSSIRIGCQPTPKANSKGTCGAAIAVFMGRHFKSFNLGSKQPLKCNVLKRLMPSRRQTNGGTLCCIKKTQGEKNEHFPLVN